MSEALPKPVTQRLRLAHWVTLDSLLGIFVFFTGYGISSISGHYLGYGPPIWLDVAMNILIITTMATRRLFPTASLGIALACILATGVMQQPERHLIETSYVLSWIWIVRSTRTGLISAAATLAIYLIRTFLCRAAQIPGNPRISNLPFPNNLTYGSFESRYALAFIFAASAAGWGIRRSRAYIAGLKNQAEMRASRAVIDERFRIAREMHDILGHSLSMIAVQAERGARIVRVRPEQTQPTLSSIAARSRVSIQDIRRVLDVLRAPEEPSPSPVVDVKPRPGLSHIDGLVADLERLGIAMTVEVCGPRRELPASVDLAAYRIVQEALTNIVKHVGVTDSFLRLSYTEHDLTLEVSDNGSASGTKAVGPCEPGRGLTGMRERDRVFGGELTVSRPDCGGFRVAARLPVTEWLARAAAPPPAESGAAVLDSSR